MTSKPPTITSGPRKAISAAIKRFTERKTPWGLRALSNELVYEIVGYIDSQTDIAHLCLAGRQLYYLFFPRLYSSVDVKSMRLCFSTLLGLLAKPHLAQRVEALSLTPCFEQEVTLDGLFDEEELADILRKIAPNLYRLRSFIWNGFEAPTDEIWATLRKHCPLLKSVGSSIGKRPIDCFSYLFDFKDLVSFTFIVTWHENYSMGHLVGSEESLPPRLWNMLYGSKNLQSLTLGGPTWKCPRFLDVRPLTYGNWPKLTSLSLGDTLMRYDPDTQPCHFAHFLHHHSSLKSLHLPGTRHYANNIFIPEPTFLPKLEAYTASLSSLSGLPHLPNLTCLRLTTEHYAYWVLPLLTWTLSRLSSLTSFAIWLDFSFATTDFERDHCNMIFQALGCCNDLEYLEILCSTEAKYAFRFEDVATPLQETLPRLKRLVIHKVHKSTDIEMLQSAVQLVQENPRMQHITLRSTEGRWNALGPTYVRKTGMYTVVHNALGIPVRLRVFESGLKLFGRTNLHYTYNLPAQNQSTKMLPLNLRLK